MWNYEPIPRHASAWTYAARWQPLGDGTVIDRCTRMQWAAAVPRIIPGATGVHASNQIQVARGAWLTGTAYAAADLVAQGGLFYVCATGHTSGTFADDLAAGLWRLTVWTASAANLTTPGTHTWANAVANCLALSYAGFDDWVLPDVEDMLRLRVWDVGSYAATIYAAAFPDVSASTSYWTSRVYANNSNSAWYSSFAYSSGPSPYSKTNALAAWPMRGPIYG